MQNKYSLWKNSLLILTAIIGIIYAIPNLYTEVPVVQISSADHSDQLTPDFLQNLLKNLNIAKIANSSIQKTSDGLEIRFSSTDAQLLVAEYLKEKLNSEYTVALNLSSTTPKWLKFIGAEPMKQGLDLRGGVHFLLEVDVDSVINRYYEGVVKNIGQSLREINIRYSGLRYQPSQGITLRFRDLKSLQDANNYLIGLYPNLVFTSKNISDNNLELVAYLSDHEAHLIRQTTIEQTMSILRNRVNELGVGEAIVQQQGSTRIAVDLPGIQDAARAKQILGGTATLEFHLVDSEHDISTTLQTGTVPIGSKWYKMDGTPILLKRHVLLSGDSITSAMASFDQQTALPAVQIQLGGGESMFTRATRANIGHRMAIVYVETKTKNIKINNITKNITTRIERVISAPVIQSALGSDFQITGLNSQKEANDLSLLLRAGALPAAIYPVAERTVGPSLGRENVQHGLISLSVGMACILVIMILYYRLFGLIANIALLLNLILLIALLSMIGATLTFPGIAGIVLTVGMAVDANILIYERIREELRRGLSAQAAIYAGYERAFATILDANITTFIVAGVLFSVGAGPIRGFAVTLSLGLITSMITGVSFTRALVNAVYGRRKNIKKLSIGI